MYKQSIEVSESLRGIITVEMDEDGRDVIIYIRQSRNQSITNQATIRVSPESLYDLVYPIVSEVADQLKLEEEMF